MLKVDLEFTLIFKVTHNMCMCIHITIRISFFRNISFTMNDYLFLYYENRIIPLIKLGEAFLDNSDE